MNLDFDTTKPYNMVFHGASSGLDEDHPEYRPGASVLKLYALRGPTNQRVFFPQGIYRTTRPLTIRDQYWLEGDKLSTTVICPDYRGITELDPNTGDEILKVKGEFNALESLSSYMQREHPYQTNTDLNFMASCKEEFNECIVDSQSSVCISW